MNFPGYDSADRSRAPKAGRWAFAGSRPPHLKGLTVLNLEDNAMDASLTRELLGENLPECSITVVATREDYLRELQRPGPGYDIILSDFTLPSFDGFEAFEIARGLAPNSSFIFYSGTISDELALQATRLGATDYVHKDSAIRLVTAVERARREFEDAKRRRDAEAGLRRSEERYRLLIEQASDAVFVHDHKGRFLEVNRMAASASGYSREDLLGMSVADLESELPLTVLQTRWKELAGDKPITFCGRQRRKDGSSFPVEIRLSRFESDGELKYIALVRDITERVAAEAQIREQNELLNRAKDAIVVMDMQNRVLFWNHGAESLFGYEAAEAMGELIGKFTGAADLSQFSTARQSVLAHGEWAGEMRARNRHANDINVDMRLSLVRDDRGAPRAIIAIGSDVTEQQKLREQFYRMQRLESVGALAAGIAHDLNNILAPITLAVPMLRASTTDLHDLRLLKMVESSVLRGTGLVRQVLAFADGKSSDSPVIQVKHLFNDVVELMRATFPKTIALEHTRPVDLWPVQGNATHVHQILLNLCINARDAMADGGTLKLHAENVSLDEREAEKIPGARAGHWLLLSVEDSGNGIAPEILERIWEPFFSTKKDQGGTGLGLSTVRDIVGKHEGFLTLRTEMGKGTRFQVYLRASTAGDFALQEDDSKFVPFGTGELVLVVEDDDFLRDVTTAVLSRHRYEVVEAKNGVAALEIFATRASEFHLVVTDIEMPEMDGVTMARIIRKIRPHVAILTVSGSEKAMLQLAQSGISTDELLLKPFTAEVLVQRVQVLLQKHALPHAV